MPDISTQGMFTNTPRVFPIGAVLNERFTLTRSNFEVVSRSEIRYCLPGVGIGAGFIDITPEAQQAIEDDLRVRELSPR